MFKEMVCSAIHITNMTILFHTHGSVFYVDYVTSTNPVKLFRALKELSEGYEWICGKMLNKEFHTSVSKRVNMINSGENSIFKRAELFSSNRDVS